MNLYHVMESAASAPAYPDQRTVALVNTYIVRSAEMVNDFSASCEETLHQVHLALNEADTRLQLLECQLAAVPDCILSANAGAAPPDSAASDPLSAAVLEGREATAADCALADDAGSSGPDSHASDADYHEAEAELGQEGRAACLHSSGSTPEELQTLRQASSPQSPARHQIPPNPREQVQGSSLTDSESPT